MFGLGGTEVLVLFVLALLLFGPRKLPEIGRSLGKAMSELRRATYDFRTGLEREVQLDKIRETGESLQRDLSATDVDRVSTAGGPSVEDRPTAAKPGEPTDGPGRNEA